MQRDRSARHGAAAPNQAVAIWACLLAFACSAPPAEPAPPAVAAPAPVTAAPARTRPKNLAERLIALSRELTPAIDPARVAQFIDAPAAATESARSFKFTLPNAEGTFILDLPNDTTTAAGVRLYPGDAFRFSDVVALYGSKYEVMRGMKAGTMVTYDDLGPEFARGLHITVQLFAYDTVPESPISWLKLQFIDRPQP